MVQIKCRYIQEIIACFRKKNHVGRPCSPPTPPPGAMGGRQAARGHALRRKPDPMQQLPAGYPSRVH